MNRETRKVAKKLQQIAENNLTKEIIIPLFKKLGFLRVEFFGGQSEEGKDIVIWNKDEFGDIELHVAQVKHFKFNNIASDSKSFQTIINQLIMCFTKKLVNTDQKPHYPSKVFLISTYPIDTKTLLTRLGTHPNLKDQSIKIIDGYKLSELLIKNCPVIIKTLLGVGFEIKSKIPIKFNNEILLEALKSPKKKDLKNIYSDIDFSIGKITTKLFFQSSFQPKKENLKLNRNEWLLLNQYCNKIEKVFPLNFLSKELKTIENENIKLTNSIIKIEQETNKINSLLISLKKSLDQNQKSRNIQLGKIKLIESELKTYKKETSNQIQKYIINLSKDIEEEERKVLFENKKSEIRTERKHAERKIDEKKKKEQTNLNKIKSKINQLEKSIYKENEKLEKLEFKTTNLFYTIHVDGQKLVDTITKEKKWIEEQVIRINKNTPSTVKLKIFFSKCELIMEAASIIFNKKNKKLFSFIGIDDNINFRKNYETTRLKLTIDSIFDTGMNISVMGDAGAGKSTSLEMYADSRKDSSKLTLLIPLGMMVQFEIDSESELDSWIFNYLNKKGVDITLKEFQNLIDKQETALLLDGLDEAMKIAPWLPERINDFSKKYKKSQIIVTSRMHGNYVNRIPFFNVTLLPFTIKQRDEFIYKWFEKEKDFQKIIKKIHKHLDNNKGISNIIRNPLLTTTICVLAEHNLTLPKTEIKLYDERLLLLTGYYDNVKHIVTRISSSPKTLEKLAQKLSFHLHTKSTREESLETLQNVAIASISDKSRREEAIIALQELMSPCEILVPMSQDGKYGFGHLRYQEHLAARELSNRSINFIPYLSQTWWSSSIIMFSMSFEKLDWLIQLIGKRGLISLPIVDEIINSRNKIEKEILNDLKEKFLLLKYGNLPTLDLDLSMSDEIIE